MSSLSSRLLLLVLLLPLAPSPIIASPLRHHYPHVLRNQHAIEASVAPFQQCTIQGNSDFYGLGIRIGIYLQWISSFLANIYLTEAISGTLETNTIFLLAMFAAMIVATTRQSIQNAEIIVLLYLCFGFLLSTLSVWGHRARSPSGKPIGFPLIGSFFRLSLTTAVCAYAVWFWYSGVHRFTLDGCVSQAFLFAEVDALRGARIFFQTVSTVLMLVYGALFVRESLMIFFFSCVTMIWTMAVATVYAIFSSSNARSSHHRPVIPLIAIKRWFRITHVIFWSWSNGKESSGPKRPDSSFWVVLMLDIGILALRSLTQIMCLFAFKKAPPIGFPPLIPLMNMRMRGTNEATIIVKLKEFGGKVALLDLSRLTLCTINMLCLLWAIAAVELSLYWNQITGVYTIGSTGQLIPFIIGIVGLLRLFHGLSVEESNLKSIDILMQLLDLNGSSPLSVDSDAASDCDEDIETYSMHDGTEAFFYVDKRESYTVAQSDQGSESIKSPHSQIVARRSLNLSQISFDPFQVDEDACSADLAHSLGLSTNGGDNIEPYKTSDGRDIRFVKDFRKPPYHLLLRLPRVGRWDTAGSRSRSLSLSPGRSTRARSTSPRPGVAIARSAQARSTHSAVREPGHLETSSQPEPRTPSRDSHARSSLGYDRSEHQTQPRRSEPISPLSSYRHDRYRRDSWQSANPEPKRMNRCLRILLQIPLLICLCTCLVGVKIIRLACGPLLAHVKARAISAREEFYCRFIFHLAFIGSGLPRDNAAPSHTTNPTDASAEPGAENNTSGSPITTTAPSSWPHRRKKNWVPQALSTAFKTRALYPMTLELCKALTDASAKGGAVKTCARMQLVTEALKSVRRVRTERNEGVVSLEGQREEALRWYGDAFDEKFGEVFVEEYDLIEKGFRGYVIR